MAKFYYYPGWWERGPTLEVQINLDEWKKLPPLYQAALETAAYQSNTIMLAGYDAQNSKALEKLLKTGIQVSAYSQEILEAAEKASFALYYNQFAAKDADFKAVYEQWKPFRDQMYAWNNLNEGSLSRYAYGKLKLGN